MPAQQFCHLTHRERERDPSKKPPSLNTFNEGHRGRLLHPKRTMERNASRLASPITSCLSTGVTCCKSQPEGSDRGREAVTQHPLQGIEGTPITSQEFMSDVNCLISQVFVLSGPYHHLNPMEEVHTLEIPVFHRFYSYQRDLANYDTTHQDAEHITNKQTNNVPTIILECFVYMIS